MTTDLLRLGTKLDQIENQWLAVTVADLKALAAHRAGMPPIGNSMSNDQRDAFTNRLFSLIDEIQTHKATTLDGLAVLTRAAVLSRATEWVNGDGDLYDQLFVESVCGFLGVTPVSDRALAIATDDGRTAS